MPVLSLVLAATTAAAPPSKGHLAAEPEAPVAAEPEVPAETPPPSGDAKEAKDEVPAVEAMEASSDEPAEAAPADEPPASAAPGDPAAPAKPPPSLDQALEAARRVGRSWDLQVEVGLPFYATFFDNSHFDTWLAELGEIYSFQDVRTPVFVRARMGFLLLDEPWYLGIGATVSYGGLGGAAVGAQADLTNTWGGVWGQAETAWSFTDGLMLSIGFGYKLMGIEIKVADGGRDVAFLGKVRIPIGLILYVRNIHDRPKAAPSRPAAGL